MIHTDTVVMVEPCHFSFNEETSKSNIFQNNISDSDFHLKALNEFKKVVETLEASNIKVCTFKSPVEYTPDAVFPNNWLSTHLSNQVVLYPMLAKNRRLERQNAIVDFLNESFLISKKVDLSPNERKGQYLEGTGSLILDRKKNQAFACASERSSKIVFDEFCQKLGYTGHWIKIKPDFKPIYHTNVLMSLLHGIAVICLEVVENKKELLSTFEELGYQVIDISFEQLKYFCANIIGFKVGLKSFTFMSNTAHNAMNKDQINKLEAKSQVVTCDIPTIEKVSGGSLRCMLAEVFHGN